MNIPTALTCQRQGHGQQSHPYPWRKPRQRLAPLLRHLHHCPAVLRRPGSAAALRRGCPAGCRRGHSACCRRPGIAGTRATAAGAPATARFQPRLGSGSREHRRPPKLRRPPPPPGPAPPPLQPRRRLAGRAAPSTGSPRGLLAPLLNPGRRPVGRGVRARVAAPAECPRHCATPAAATAAGCPAAAAPRRPPAATVPAPSGHKCACVVNTVSDVRYITVMVAFRPGLSLKAKPLVTSSPTYVLLDFQQLHGGRRKVIPLSAPNFSTPWRVSVACSRQMRGRPWPASPACRSGTRLSPALAG